MTNPPLRLAEDRQFAASVTNGHGDDLVVDFHRYLGRGAAVQDSIAYQLARQQLGHADL
ncbi:MAG TPA: hypothetical protein VHV57_16535 [Acidimicrobiales bacterium]|nr:hypothetical protein [Acidimicrobiales bacterium]